MKRICELSLVLWAVWSAQIAAIETAEPLADPEHQALFEALTREVRCLVCQNQNIADSTAPLAADLRREIRTMIEAGQGEVEIKRFLTERYGDFVLYRPPLETHTLLLWIAPALLLMFGGIAYWRVLSRRRTGQDEAG